MAVALRKLEPNTPYETLKDAMRRLIRVFGRSGFGIKFANAYSNITIIVITSIIQKTILSPKSVLVVDDDIAVCRIVHRMLSNEQYAVQTTQSVAHALEAIEQKPFDVYVVDYKLPDGSGLD